MSYRDDHEAALLRVDALEQEVARLRSAAPPAAPRPRPSGARVRAGFAILLAGAGLAALLGRERPAADAAAPAIPVVTAKPVELPRSVDGLRACIARIAPIERALDATTTDPRGAAVPLTSLAKTGADCRRELGRLAELGLDPALHARFARWAATEDQLAGPIAMIGVYYGSDPYLLDGYASAPQLWREYHRAREARDAALAELAPVLANGAATR